MPIVKLAKDQILIATVGLPRSGKSTWAKVQGHPIVNPDAIRLALHGQPYLAQVEPFVWAIAGTMADALFLAGHQVVILDATNTTPERRKPWVDRYGAGAVQWQVFTTPAGECIRRAKNDGREDLVPVIERMRLSLILPDVA